MNKKEILEVLKEMLADYESALACDIEEGFFQMLASKKLALGFCYWLKHSIYFENERKIIDAISLDFGYGEPESLFYWYPLCFKFNNSGEVKDNCLMPRAEQLLRTIERLENELK